MDAKSITAEFEEELEEEVTFKIDEGEAETPVDSSKSAVTPKWRQLVERMLLYSYWTTATFSTLAPTSNPQMPAKTTPTS